MLDNLRRIKLGSRMGVSPKDENSFAPGVIYIDFDSLFLLGLIASIVPFGKICQGHKQIFFDKFISSLFLS